MTSWAPRELGLSVSGRDGVDIDRLIVPGLRRNPRRAHLWVSRVLGKHIPATPDDIVGTANELADRVRCVFDARAIRREDVLVFGFAETATGLGHCVFDALNAHAYVHSTRRARPELPVTATFAEGHSHASEHMIVPTNRALVVEPDLVVLVDDEISTGITAFDAIDAFERLRCGRSYIVASLVDMRSDDARALSDQMAAERGLSVDFVSLVHGVTQIPDDLVARVESLPDAELPRTWDDSAPRSPGGVTTVDVPWLPSIPDSGRWGIYASDTAQLGCQVAGVVAAVAAVMPPGSPVLVIGHEEFMYLPLSVAAALTRRGVHTMFQTTTRSPAYVRDCPDYPLRHGVAFVAPETPGDNGNSGIRFLYNGAYDDPAVLRVMIIDPPADTDALYGSGGLIEALTANGRDLILVCAGGGEFDAIARERARGTL